MLSGNRSRNCYRSTTTYTMRFPADDVEETVPDSLRGGIDKLTASGDVQLATQTHAARAAFQRSNASVRLSRYDAADAG